MQGMSAQLGPPSVESQTGKLALDCTPAQHPGSPGLAGSPCSVGLGVGGAGVAAVEASLGLNSAGWAVLAYRVCFVGKGACISDTPGKNKFQSGWQTPGKHTMNTEHADSSSLPNIHPNM